MTPDEIRQQLNTKTDRINSQRNLTPTAKQTMIARAFVEARDALDQVKQSETDRIGRERKQLERKLFGSNGFSLDPNAAVSRRDAADRAAKIETAEEALRTMQRAERDGDTTLAKAIASRAADYSGDPVWANVVTTYVADKPSEADTLKAMQQLPDTEDAMWRMQQAMQYGIATPSELGQASGYQVDALAERPLDGDVSAA
ncbi:hypothetical protein ACFVZL_19880 [Streptomyces sp. NPDC058320]|uniref:hypothetical protein n=1 Tax=unclassified Streptomyces TaxID=2593676 RepID=UPI0036313769